MLILIFNVHKISNELSDHHKYMLCFLSNAINKYYYKIRQIIFKQRIEIKPIIQTKKVVKYLP